VGREIFGAAQIVFLIFAMGSHILTFSIMLNTLTNHGTCSIVFGVVGLLLWLVCTLLRTLKKVSYMAIVSFISIIAAVLITMIGVGIGRPGSGKVRPMEQSKPTSPRALKLLRISSLHTQVRNLAWYPRAWEWLLTFILGHVAFFFFISELHTPKSYPKALFFLQGVDVSMYLIVAIVTYRYAGTGVKAPALSSASPLL